VDKDGETIEAYKVDGYPDYFIIDRDGTLAVADCANDKVEAVLEKLLQKQTR
jgi:cytochrome c biogenesis protein CcmG/thiol:disulfide interchange protein DsbE